jgi:hypothetical protein
MIDSILEALRQFTDWVLSLFVDFFVYLLNLIPVPEFVEQAKDAISTFGDYAGYPLYLIAFDVGFPMVVSAVLLKFLIRRLPFIG